MSRPEKFPTRSTLAKQAEQYCRTPRPRFTAAAIILALSILVGGIALSALVADIAFLMGPPL